MEIQIACISEKNWNELDKANLFGRNFCQGKNDYKTGGIFYALFLAPKKIHFNYRWNW